MRAPPKQGLALPRLLLRLDHLDQEIHEARHAHHVPTAAAEGGGDEAAGAPGASVGAQLDRLGRSSGHAARGPVDVAGAGAEAGAGAAAAVWWQLAGCTGNTRIAILSIDIF